MKRKSNSEAVKPHVTKGSVLIDLGFSPAEALEIRVKSEIYRDLLDYIKDRGLTQQQLGEELGLHQPDVSNLLSGRASKFSVGKLIKLAGKLNLGAQIKLTRPSITNAAGDSASARARKSPKVAA